MQRCGDTPLLNFGVYGSPERQLLFGINDFTQAALNRDSRQAVPPLWQPMPQGDSRTGTA